MGSADGFREISNKEWPCSRMHPLKALPGRIAAVESQILQLRAEMKDGISALRAEIREGDEATRTCMRMSFEDLVTRIATIREGAAS